MPVKRMTATRRRSTSSKRRPSLRGKGDYSLEVTQIKDPLSRLEGKIDHLEKSLVKNPLSKANAASLIGRTLGNFVNQGDLGAMAGSGLAKLFGHGDYHISSNSLMSGNPQAMSGAKFSSNGARGTRIREREFLGNVSSGLLSGASTVFTNATYNINPSDPLTFPWLSNLSPLFDQWEPHGMVFEYVSTSSEFNGASQALGAVIMATEYDPYDPAYSSKQQMENSDYACSTKPSLGLLHGLECDPKERPVPLLYTATTNGAPATSTSLGRFQIATQGCSAAGVTLGELWISYDITFYKKQLNTVAVSTSPFLSGTGTTTAGGGPLSNIAISASNIITIVNSPTVSIIQLNNAAIGEKYEFTYYFLSHQSANNYANWAPFGGTVTVRLGGGSVVGQPIIVTYVMTVTDTDAFLGSIPTTPTVNASAYAFAVARVPNGYVF